MKEQAFSIQHTDPILDDVAQAVYKSTQTGAPLVVLLLGESGPSADGLNTLAARAVVLRLQQDSEQFREFQALFHRVGEKETPLVAAPCVLLTEQSRITRVWQVSQNDPSWDTQLGKLSAALRLRVGGYSYPNTPSNTPTPQASSGKYTLRIKLDDSSCVEHAFNPCTTSLKDVKAYVANVLNRKLAYDLAFYNVWPKRRYSKTQERMSLNTLNLKPRSTLYLLENREYIRELRRTRNVSQDFKYIMFCVNKIRSMFRVFPLGGRRKAIRSRSNTEMHSKSFATVAASGIERIGTPQSGSLRYTNQLPDSTPASSNNQN